MKILIADDHELVRDGLREHLVTLSENVEILEAAGFDDVFALKEKNVDSPIDIILIDLYMPGMVRDDPIAALRTTCEAFPGTPVVVMSGMFDTPLVDAALKSGARGFLPKISKGKTILSALRLVLDGEIYIPPSVMVDGPGEGRANATALHQVEAHPVSRLSLREKTTLMLLVEGKTNKEIARLLNLTEVSIKMQLRSAYRKMGAANRIDATRIALEYQRLTNT